MKEEKTYPINEPALRWLETILSERFDHRWHLSRTPQGLFLALEGAEGRIFFDNLRDCFTKAQSNYPCAEWNAESEGWESVLGSPIPAPGFEVLHSPLIDFHNKEHIVHYDIIGLTYWMLARVEEIGRVDLDAHGRFHAVSSHAYKYHYISRPIVDEWMYVLKQVIRRQWPLIPLKEHTYSVQISHDVDRPFFYLDMSWLRLMRIVIGDIVKRHHIGLSIRRIQSWFKVSRGNLNADPYNTFNWLMDVSEAHHVKSCFYFICGRSDKYFDPLHNINIKYLLNILKEINSRGHEIGLHPSYNCFNSKSRIYSELNNLKKLCISIGIKKKEFKSRMHYLRWEQPWTIRALSESGITHDTTLIYPDSIGFRCGTCYEYPSFDALHEETINLRITPLIIMDQLLLDEPMKINGRSAFDTIFEIARKIKKVNGILSILWHNCSLENSKYLYIKIMNMIFNPRLELQTLGRVHNREDKQEREKWF